MTIQHAEAAGLSAQLRELGLSAGDSVMVHSSFKRIGVRDPDAVILALLDAVGPEGVLLMPALSYLQQPPDVHDTDRTPSCVGFLAEYYRLRPGSRRSLHPTHSVCASGPRAGEWLGEHTLDTTPCGPHSPFHLLPQHGGKILMLGCGWEPNTIMHAVEEHVRPPYLFGDPVIYTITDHDRRTFRKEYLPHDFRGVIQRYDRMRDLLSEEAVRRGPVGSAEGLLIRSEILFPVALERLWKEPLFFIDPEPAAAEGR
jgi:aminoglycoside 3-N-acetyltransferase